MFEHPTKRKRASMQKVSIIGLDLAKRAFQAHGAHADGRQRVLPKEAVA
jgi:hypothetical protein